MPDEWIEIERRKSSPNKSAYGRRIDSPKA